MKQSQSGESKKKGKPKIDKIVKQLGIKQEFSKLVQISKDAEGRSTDTEVYVYSDYLCIQAGQALKSGDDKANVLVVMDQGQGKTDFEVMIAEYLKTIDSHR